MEKKQGGSQIASQGGRDAIAARLDDLERRESRTRQYVQNLAVALEATGGPSAEITMRGMNDDLDNGASGESGADRSEVQAPRVDDAGAGDGEVAKSLE